MHTRRLGKNHLAVSAMGLGCWGMSHAYGPADEKESLATMETALDLGINFFDTADVYGDGHNVRSEPSVYRKFPPPRCAGPTPYIRSPPCNPSTASGTGM